MPRAGDPRVTVRFSPEEFAALERAARVRGVPNAAMVRECVARWAAWAASDPAGTKVRMRRRSSPVPVPAASADLTAADASMINARARVRRRAEQQRVPSGPSSSERALRTASDPAALIAALRGS